MRANAYAIAFRLLGERDAANTAVDAAIDRARTDGSLGDPAWMCALAAAAVAASLAAPAVEPPPPDDALRTELRRRLGAATTDERIASSLRHLAGYPLDAVAAFMQRPVPDTELLAHALDPAPGVGYRELGDPDLVGRRVERPPRSVPHPSRSTVLSLVIVLVLALGASRCVGARPTLGPAAPPERVTVAPDVAARPSPGCATPNSPSPRPLVVVLAGDAPDGPLHAGFEQAATDAGASVETVPADTLAAVTRSGGDPDATVASVIRRAEAQSCIDLARVTVTGFGAGGQLATAFACRRADAVTVVAPVAGASVPDDCDLSPAVSLQMQWNADDPVMPPTGGTGVGEPAASLTAGLPADPAGRVAERWAAGIDAGPLQRDVDADGTTVDQSTAANGAAVRSIIRPTGGHAWNPTDTATVLEFARTHARAPG